MTAPSPGVELVLELVRAAARERRCAACGRSLMEADVRPGDADPERIVARLHCPCGADEVVEVRPAADAGSAEIR